MERPDSHRRVSSRISMVEFKGFKEDLVAGTANTMLISAYGGALGSYMEQPGSIADWQ